MFDRLVKACTACECRTHFTPIPGIGPKRARIFFVGRNPGETEVRVGEPFVGLAGRRLDQVIEELSLVRKHQYITNVMKCFTLRNKKPPEACVSCCAALWLEKELYEIKPTLVVALGQEAQTALPKLSKLFPTFNMVHPSAALRAPIYEAILRQQTRRLSALLHERNLV